MKKHIFTLKCLITATLICCAFVLFPTLSFAQKQKKIDSLKTILKSANTNDSTRIKTLISLCKLYRKTKADTSLLLAKQATDLAEKTKNAKWLALSNKNLGSIYYSRFSYDTAITYFNVSITYLQETNNLAEIVICYNSQGGCYAEMGNYDKAIEKYFASLKINEQLNDKSIAASCYNNIGAIHFFQNNLEKAREYYMKALIMQEELKDSSGVAGTLSNIGIVFSIQKKYDEANNYFEKALKIDAQIGNKTGMADCYLNIGNNSDGKKDYHKALEYSFKALEIYKTFNEKNGLANVLSNIGGFNNKLKNYQEAIKYSLQALAISKEIGTQAVEKDIYRNLSESYENTGKPDKALMYHKMFSNLNDTLFNQEKHKQFSDMEAKYQNEKKKKEIELKNIEIAKSEADIKQKNTQLFAFLFGSILLIGLVIAVFISYKQKQKANILLTQQKGEIVEKNTILESQKEEIRSQAEELAETNHELEKLSIVASETDNAVAIFDKEGNLEWFNAGSTRMYGYTFEEYIQFKGKNILALSSNVEIKRVIEKCLSDKKTMSYESKNTTKDGRNLWVQTTITPIVNDECKVTKLIAIDSDISKLKEAEFEIMQRNEEISAQRDEIQEKSSKIEHQNEQITSSIRYAQTIQQAILPIKDLIDKYIESFIIYRPKDIVSGDFYWFTTLDNYIFVAVVDCTGHGVPGAFMSMIGSRLLSEIVNQLKITTPSEILTKLNENIRTALKQEQSENNDGMDICLCRLERKQAETKVLFSAAKRTLYFYDILKRKVELMKGDVKSIGGRRVSPNQQPFTNQELILTQGSMLYLSSDGYKDQCNPQREKMGNKNFVELIEKVATLNIEKQKEQFETALDNHKKNEAQRDDITLIGLKI